MCAHTKKARYFLSYFATSSRPVGSCCKGAVSLTYLFISVAGLDESLELQKSELQELAPVELRERVEALIIAGP